MNELVTVDFHGVQLVARRGDTQATTLIAMKPISEGMGLDWEGQRQRINRNPVLAQGACEIQAPSAGGLQAMTAIPLSRLNFWLATIQPNKIPDPETRARVIRYQMECADVLFAHFFGKAASPISASTIGGIVKAVVGKAFAERDATIAALQTKIDTLVIEHDTRVAAIEYRPALDVLKEHGVPSKGRGHLSRQVSARMRRHCIASGHQMHIRQSRETGRYLYHVDSWAAWLNASGTALIEARKAAMLGQGVLPFRKPAPVPVPDATA